MLVHTDVVNVSPSVSECPFTPDNLHANNLLKCVEMGVCVFVCVNNYERQNEELFGYMCV